MRYECNNVYYFRHLNRIGGIESHLRYLAKKYDNYDITVFYKTADMEQVDTLRRYVRCVQLEPNDFVVCNKLFCCFNREILNQCKWNESYLVLHGDYKAMIEKGQLNMGNLPIDSRIDHYLGVSQLVCDSWEELTGIKAKNVYEPVVLDKCEKQLMFVSATRLTPEKGWARMELLAKKLDEVNVNYTWVIYTDSPKTPLRNMVFVQPRLDVTNKIGSYDAFIQLSDNEGFCLSIVEALMQGVPVIATDLPVLKEIGLNKDNSIILPFDMENIPIDEIKNIRSKKFTYKQPKDKWSTVLDKTPKSDELIHVRATDVFQRMGLWDQQLGHIPHPGEEWYVTKGRLEDYMKYGEKHRMSLVSRV